MDLRQIGWDDVDWIHQLQYLRIPQRWIFKSRTSP